MINWDGGFAPCCYLTDKTEDFGDVNESPVKSIWNGADYTTARGLFKKNFTPDRWVGCLDCSVYLGSSAARSRGPVDLHPEPQLLQVNGKKPAKGNGARPGSELPPVEITADSHGQRNEDAEEAMGDKPV